MSQFIQLKQTIPIEPQAILKGITSKIVEPSLKPRNLSKYDLNDKNIKLPSSSAVLKTKTDKRFVQEVKVADQLQRIIISKDYSSMKKRLDMYGRSKSSKISIIMDAQKHTSYFDEQQQSTGHFRRLSKDNSTNSFKPHLNIDMLSVIKRQQQLAKVRYSIGNIFSAKDTNHRVVFVDRKYNRQFAIKKSSLIETQEIMMGKQNYKQFLTRFRRKDPLVKQADATRSKFPSEYVKTSLQSAGIIKKGRCLSKDRLYRGKRLSESSYEILSWDYSGINLMKSGQFFNKQGPSLQGEQMMVCAHKQSQNEGSQVPKKKEGKVLRKKFTLSHKQAMNFFSLRKNHPSPIKHKKN